MSKHQRPLWVASFFILMTGLSLSTQAVPPKRNSPTAKGFERAFQFFSDFKKTHEIPKEIAQFLLPADRKFLGVLISSSQIPPNLIAKNEISSILLKYKSKRYHFRLISLKNSVFALNESEWRFDPFGAPAENLARIRMNTNVDDAMAIATYVISYGVLNGGCAATQHTDSAALQFNECSQVNATWPPLHNIVFANPNERILDVARRFQTNAECSSSGRILNAQVGEVKKVQKTTISVSYNNKDRPRLIAITRNFLKIGTELDPQLDLRLKVDSDWNLISISDSGMEKLKWDESTADRFISYLRWINDICSNPRAAMYYKR